MSDMDIFWVTASTPIFFLSKILFFNLNMSVCVSLCG